MNFRLDCITQKDLVVLKLLQSSLSALSAVTMRSSALLLLSLSFLPSFEAFVTLSLWKTRQQTQSTPIGGTNGIKPVTRIRIQATNDEMGNEQEENYEQVRRRLEAMMGNEGEQGASPVLHQRRSSETFLSGDQLPAPPPLTAIAKERRIAEIQALARLVDSDEGLDDLWSLWFSERGPRAARELQAIEALVEEGPRSWGEAEERLRDLIDEHGVYFVEPVNRLATLLFLQGRLEESRELCEVVLSVKPWHFGASSGIVMVCAGLGDPMAARTWATRRLPPIQPSGSNKRRQQWVERAVGDATKALFDAERRVKRAFGEPDVYPPKLEAFTDEDAWQ